MAFSRIAAAKIRSDHGLALVHKISAQPPIR